MNNLIHGTPQVAYAQENSFLPFLTPMIDLIELNLRAATSMPGLWGQPAQQPLIANMNCNSVEDYQKSIMACLDQVYGHPKQYETPSFIHQSDPTRIENPNHSNILNRLEEVERGQQLLKRMLNFNVGSPQANENNSTVSTEVNQTTNERQLKIQRYKSKRRNWIKKVAYECRKKVADDRLRVKGRFISKEDQSNIAKLVPTNEVFDEKKNLNLKKFQSQIKLFFHVNPKKISKNTILKRIRYKANEEQIHAQLLGRIISRQQIFQIEVERFPKKQATPKSAEKK